MVIFMDYRIEELLPIISGLAMEYGGYESTSITYEKAQELMEAVLFCLNEYQDSNPCAPARRDISTKEQYRIGMKLVFEKVERIRKIFNEITLQFEDFGVKCLYDTVQKGIPRFLKWYNIKFCPQNTILTLDYPLLADYGSLKGADAVYQYILAIRTEQLFLCAFRKRYILLVLEKYNSEYQDMAENICGIVLTNMIGHIAVRKVFDDTEFTNAEYQQLSKMFSGKSISEIEEVIKNFIGEITGRFYDNNMELSAYLYCEANNIAVRIYTANQYGALSRVFLL